MLKKEFDYILEHRKWPLSSITSIDNRPPRFGVILGATAMLFIDILMLNVGFHFGYSDTGLLGRYITIIAGLIVGLFLIFLIIINIPFQRIFTTVKVDRDYNTKELLRVAHNLGWKGTTDSANNVVEVSTPNSFFFGGERITIVILERELLFNSRHIRKIRLVDHNRKNLQEFLAEIETV